MWDRFQGFDSAIYSVILADPHFIKYFDVGGAKSGVVASMSKSLPVDVLRERQGLC